MISIFSLALFVVAYVGASLWLARLLLKGVFYVAGLLSSRGTSQGELRTAGHHSVD